jgi:SAM-dependent methyltransferase
VTVDARVREFYDDFADYQIGYLSRPNPRLGEIRHRLLPLLDRAPRSALDIGCGIGIQTDWLASRVENVVGVDVSPRSIVIARALYERPAFEVCGLPGERLPGGPFDLVTAFDVVEHFQPETRAAVFERIGAVLADSGVLAVNVPSKLFSLQTSVESQQVIDEPVGADEIVALAGSQGLEPLALDRYGIDAANQYVFGAFSRTYDVQASPPLSSPPLSSMARRLVSRAAAMRTRREGARLMARIKDL